jgi:hypothetical protein
LAEHEQTAEERVDALWARMRGKVVEAVEQHSPDRADLKFDEIESNSASIGDLMARMLIEEALKEQAKATTAEIEAARQSLAQEARAIGQTPGQLRMTRMPARTCEIGTVRGPVPHQREYLYFPELKRGVFPPRPAAKHS